MRTTFVAVMVGFGMLLGAPVWAHHSFSAEFDANKPLKLKGTLVKWQMINPHSWFQIEVKNDDGTVTTWLLEGGSPNQLIRMGVNKNSVPIGTELLIDAYMAKDGTNKAVGRDFTFSDGRRLFLGGSAPGATPEADKK